jgi:hypothetical protein
MGLRFTSPYEFLPTPQVWVAPGSGTVLCADDGLSDCLGVGPEEVAGRSFSSAFGAEPEVLDRWGRRPLCRAFSFRKPMRGCFRV